MTFKARKLLGINVDHVATLRQARLTSYPDPVEAGIIALENGADAITIHLREDRRHIQEKDVERFCSLKDVRVNLEMANTDEMIEMALRYRPQDVCIVPEKREELTTEGGLDVIRHKSELKENISKLQAVGIRVSLFVEANEGQINAAASVNANLIELHTGHYANLESMSEEQKIELANLERISIYAHSLGLGVNAGHGLNRLNVNAVAKIDHIEELNIGHSIIADAVLVGIGRATADMRQAIDA